jgi:ATP-dependent Lon protease
MSDTESLFTLPLLPIKNSVLFPSVLLPLTVGRPLSLAAVEAALAREDKELIVATQREASIDAPGPSDFFSIGTKAVLKRMAQRPDGGLDLMVQGLERVVLVKIEATDSTLTARGRLAPIPEVSSTEIEALQRAILDLARRAIELAYPNAPAEFLRLLTPNTAPLRQVYALASLLSLDLAKEQALLEASTMLDAMRLLHSDLQHEVQVLELRQQITSQAQDAMSRQQREYLLRQQLQAIQQELGEEHPERAEATLLRQRLTEADLPEAVRQEAERELTRLEQLPAAAPDYHVIRTYLDVILELPWRKSTPDQLDLARARQVLAEDHFGLHEVKERILEHLGVLKLNPTAKAPILCFVGPPGVGKTSLGQSIARALGRAFERLSLGGMHDEAELRGHRRTYIGALPGGIVQALRRAQANNPVLMLDEIDKLGRDFRGDPAAALLEILDPAQNHTFRDHYLDLPFDLSRVLFITTANTLGTIPQPLLDRMEVLELSGYSAEEKCEIAQRYLIPRQLQATGLRAEQFSLTETALRQVIARYTREAGVRHLERTIGRLARRVALGFAEGRTEPVTVAGEDLAEMLGPERFSAERARQHVPPGVATGLAWTEAGGDVLYIEASLLPTGTGLTLTGQLGEVMQESARAAQSFLWAHAEALGIEPRLFKESGVHVHVPAGAIPKDGPSAGITMATALLSAYTGLAVRRDTAMTGELTLTGLVLPIGGVKEKVLAARRAELLRVILPAGNKKDLRDLPENVRHEMTFFFVERIEDVFAVAIPGLAARQSIAAAA